MHRSTHIPGVHFFRGIAALLVVLHHAFRFIRKDFGESALSQAFVGGASGVQFFFVLSGFIIFYIHGGDSASMTQGVVYLKKRLVRVYPLYWMILLPVYTMLLISAQLMPTTSRSFGKFLGDALLLFSPNGGIVPVAWTLCHEVLFYAVFFVSFYLWKSWRSTFILWGCCCAIGSCCLLHIDVYQDMQWFKYVGFLLDINNMLFVLGMLTCCLFLQRHWLPQLARFSSPAMMLGALVYIGLMAWQSHLGFERDYNSLSFLLERVGFGFASAIILFGACFTHIALWQSRLFVLLADASYSIYLVHMFVQVAILKVIAKMHWVSLSNEAIFLFLSLTGVAAGIALHLWIEKPLLRVCRLAMA
jgi:exopolysaccharide production protein ExoZ